MWTLEKSGITVGVQVVPQKDELIYLFKKKEEYQLFLCNTKKRVHSMYLKKRKIYLIPF